MLASFATWLDRLIPWRPPCWWGWLSGIEIPCLFIIPERQLTMFPPPEPAWSLFLEVTDFSVSLAPVPCGTFLDDSSGMTLFGLEKFFLLHIGELFCGN